MPWGPGKVDQLIAFIRAHFPVPADFADHVYRDLGSVPHAAATLGTAPSAASAHFGRHRGKRTGRTSVPTLPAASSPPPTRPARTGCTRGRGTVLHPEGGLNLAHGAAGVLWSLAETGTPPPEEHIDWLIDAVSALDDPRPGFYNGLSGIAYALDHLGRTDTAAEIIGRVARTPLETTGHSLYDGLSGIGLAQLHFARRLGMARLRDRALGIADRLTSRNPAASAARSPQPGLLRGESGSALLLLRLYEETGDTALLDHAEAALRRDLDRFGWNPEKPLPPEASGHIPLIASGCGGTGMVLTAYLGHRPDPYLVTVRDAIRAAADAPFLANAGLFHGRAGALLALLAMSGTDTDTHAAVQRHLDGFALHTVSHDGRPAFLGTECLRISTDLATGAAGVLLAVDAALTGRRSAIPFL
ncbi:hypothetical protein SHKM778_77820 [Streptomyces sp. KM77-8]|uniref:Uncharacterized protein n=1 Tax=Streptomyces haneummycinicus TaxID=3074435 RepID=A0AAT9HVB9_9ACTN